MKVPYCFEDILLSQFMQLHENEINKAIEKLDKDTKRLSILSNESIEFVEDLDFATRQNFLSKISYTNNPPSDLRVVKRFKAKGTLLVPTLSLQDMKVNQLCDFYTLLKQADGNYIKSANVLLAVMFKPFKVIGESKYSPGNHAKISELLLSAKVGDCLGLLFFYLDFWRKCEPIIARCLTQANQTIEETINEMKNDKGFLDFLNSGDGNTTLINVLKTKE